MEPPPLPSQVNVIPEQHPHAPVEPPPVPYITQPPVSSPDLERRVRELEGIIESYKKITKFKRGISYSISTAKIKGEFKDPETILDLISTELAKQTKTITLKLNDSTKPKK